MRAELWGATFEMDTAPLAMALSAKTRKTILKIGEIDNIDHYTVALETDDVRDISYNTAQVALEVQRLAKVANSEERDSYPPLVKFLAYLLADCRRESWKTKLGAFFKDLRFVKYDRQTKDSTEGAHPLKPDLAGIRALEKPTGKLDLWWAPPKHESQHRIFVPVEVKTNWPDLFAQAATLHKALFSASNYVQFSLVLGYNQRTKELRFLVFHAGGLTASKALDVRTDYEDIRRLILSILAWDSPGDARLPAWRQSLDGDSNKTSKDHRSLHFHETKYAGRSLVHASSPQILVAALIHAALGMCSVQPAHRLVPLTSV